MDDEPTEAQVALIRQYAEGIAEVRQKNAKLEAEREALKKVHSALRHWASLEASRRILDYDAPDYDDLERLAGEAATELIRQARLAGIAEGLANADRGEDG